MEEFKDLIDASYFNFSMLWKEIINYKSAKLTSISKH